MKYLTDRLEFFKLHLHSMEGKMDEKERQGLLDTWIEINAVSEVLPEIVSVIPQRESRIGHYVDGELDSVHLLNSGHLELKATDIADKVNELHQKIRNAIRDTNPEASQAMAQNEFIKWFADRGVKVNP